MIRHKTLLFSLVMTLIISIAAGCGNGLETTLATEEERIAVVAYNGWVTDGGYLFVSNQTEGLE